MYMCMAPSRTCAWHRPGRVHVHNLVAPIFHAYVCAEYDAGMCHAIAFCLCIINH